MLAFFSMINNYGYIEINKQNAQGVKPGICFDVFGLNLFIMVFYSFTSKALYVYYIIPIYAVYKIWNMVGPYCCPSFFGSGAKYDEHDDDDNNGKSKRTQKREK